MGGRRSHTIPPVPVNPLRSFDPRALVIFYLCFSVAAMFVDDIRILAGLFALAAFSALLGRGALAGTRRNWITLAIVIVFFTGINLVIGRGWLFAATQALRLAALALVTLVIARAIDPAMIGIAFHKLGAPDKLAFTFSLMMRFVPTLTRDFQIATDAQRARGFELDPGRGSLLARARRFAPLLVPVVVRSVLDSEDVANAMDMRGFASRKRTWLRDLAYQPRDVALIALGLALVIALAVLVWFGLNHAWVSPL